MKNGQTFKITNQNDADDFFSQKINKNLRAAKYEFFRTNRILFFFFADFPAIFHFFSKIFGKLSARHLNNFRKYDIIVFYFCENEIVVFAVDCRNLRRKRRAIFYNVSKNREAFKNRLKLRNVFAFELFRRVSSLKTFSRVL